MKHIQAAMHENLMAAIDGYQNLSKKGMGDAELQVKEIIVLKYQMETIADQKGYSQACKASIPKCRGECCKWHFPKNLNRLDLFITLCSITVAEQNALADQLALNNGKYQCPVLRKNGCLLSFDNRPLSCSNAYPCFAGASYHEFLKKQRKKINIRHVLLKEILQKERW